jgi:hypothetical protein
VFVALGIQHAMRQIVICGLLTMKYFPTLSHKPHYFGKSIVGHKMCFDFLRKFGLKNVLFCEELSEM